MSFMDVMYGPLGQVNNQFQNNLAQNAAAMGQQQNYYNQVANIGGYNQGVTDNLYGPGGFGGDTSKYAYAGAAYGRDTGGFGGYGAANADPFSPVQTSGNDSGIAGWGSTPIGGLSPGVLANIENGFNANGDYVGREAARASYGGGAWDTQNQWGQPYAPPAAPAAPFPQADPMNSGGYGASDTFNSRFGDPGLPDYITQGTSGAPPMPSFEMPGGLPPGVLANIENGFNANGDWVGREAARASYGVGGGAWDTSNQFGQSYAPPAAPAAPFPQADPMNSGGYGGGGGGGAWDTSNQFGQSYAPPSGGFDPGVLANIENGFNANGDWVGREAARASYGALFGSAPAPAPAQGGGAWDTSNQWGQRYAPPAPVPQQPAYPLGGGGALPDYNGDMWGGLSPGVIANIENGFNSNGDYVGREAARASYGGGGKEQGRMGQGWFNEPVPPAYQPGSAYGPGYFDNSFGEANAMNAQRGAVAQAWMNQPDFNSRWGGGLNYGGGDVGAGIGSMEDALRMLDFAPYQPSTYTAPPEDNRWGGG